MRALEVTGFGEVRDDGDNAALHAEQDVAIALAAQREAADGPAQRADPVTGEALFLECDSPIPKDRLAVLPMAAFCVPCLELIERRQRLRRE